MSAGTWLVQNKVRPGTYINFETEPKPLGSLGERGLATMALPLSWGLSKEIIELEAGENPRNKLGYTIMDEELLLVREALKRAKKLLLYRLNTGTQASATVTDEEQTLTITAKYGGVRGNNITVVIQKNMDDESQFDVQTYVDGTEVDSQTVGSTTEIVENGWVTFEGELLETAGANLIGGADGEVTNSDYMDYMDAIQVREFNTMALVTEEETLKSVFVSFIKRLREDEGYKVQCVLAKYPNADYEGIISVKNGVILADGTTISAEQATAWVAGATAGANVNQSLTYTAYDDAVDTDEKYTNSQIIAALQNGEFLFVPSGGRAVVEQDINSSFTPKHGKAFSKNRVIRVFDSINNDFVRIFESFYIGKVDNNADGRNLLKSECINYLVILEGINAIQNFDPQADITVEQGNGIEDVYSEIYIQPVDALERIYMLVTAK